MSGVVKIDITESSETLKTLLVQQKTATPQGAGTSLVPIQNKTS